MRVRNSAVFRLAFLGAFTLASVPAGGQTTLTEDWRWVHFGVAEGLPSPLVNVVVRASDGTMWVGTEDGPAWFDGYRWRRVMTPDGRLLRGGRSRLFVAGTRGSVVVSVGSDLFRVEHRGAAAERLPRHSGTGDVTAIVVAAGDSVWAVFGQIGEFVLSRLDRGVWRDQAWPGNYRDFGYVPSLWAAADGSLRVGVGGALFSRRDTT